jgi:putative oxidoreductase
MKIATTIVRILMGLLLLFASLAYFFNYAPEAPPMSDDLVTFNEGLAASGYLMPFVKSLELLVAILFLTGKYVSFANLLLLPIAINIFLVHLFMGPETIGAAIFLLLGNIFLIYRYWHNYRAVFTK